MGVRVGEDEADERTGLLRGARRVHGRPVRQPEQHPARGGAGQGVEAAQQRRLAGAVGADHPDPVLGQLQVDAAQDVDAVHGQTKVLQADVHGLAARPRDGPGRGLRAAHEDVGEGAVHARSDERTDEHLEQPAGDERQHPGD